MDPFRGPRTKTTTGGRGHQGEEAAGGAVMEEQRMGSSQPPRKGYSYPSRQRRQGPAPLASFEDLPSDDQESPEGPEKGLREGSPEPGVIEKALQQDSRELLNSSPTHTLTPVPSPEATLGATGADPDPGDTSSQHTITPVAGEEGLRLLSPQSGDNQSLSGRGEGSRSSAASVANGCQRKCSEGSLLAPPENEEGVRKSPSPDSKRKGSWTDIFFRGRSRSRSKSPTDRAAEQETEGESLQKSPVAEEPGHGKKKKGIFSFLKKGKKSPSKETSDPLSPSQAHSPPHNYQHQPTHAHTNQTQITRPRDLATPRVSVTDTSENDAREELLIPSNEECEPRESQQDIIGILEAEEREKSASETSESTEPLMNPVLTRRPFKKRTDTFDDDVRSLPEILPSSRSKDRDLCKMAGNVETVVVTIERRPDHDKEHSSGSESELGIDESKLEKKEEESQGAEDDCEAANLLAQDSIDYEDAAIAELGDTLGNQSQMQLKTRRDRMEMKGTTIPIDRPRSTTPINIAPLEAFIKTACISPDPGVERIKLSLPGDQFVATARAKSPRKSNPQIWLDFCEKGLHSPKVGRRDRREQAFGQQLSTVPVSISANDAFTPVTETPSQIVTPLTPVTPLEGDEKWTTFADSFDPSSFLPSNGTVGPTECNNCDCRLGKGGLTLGLGAEGVGSPSLSEGRLLPPAEGEKRADKLRLGLNLALSVGPGSTDGEEQQPLVSPNPCGCECHKRSEFAAIMWRNASLSKQESLGLLSASSDISSASSRLMGSSSSNSLKCSPDYPEETVGLTSS